MVYLGPISPLCLHRTAVPVETFDGERVAWLCPECDTQLHPNWPDRGWRDEAWRRELEAEQAAYEATARERERLHHLCWTLICTATLLASIVTTIWELAWHA